MMLKTFSSNSCQCLARFRSLITSIIIERKSLSHVSNKRITRITSDLQIDESELNTEGNERYLNVRLQNRNPRNLEQMLLEPKMMGYDLDKKSPHYWNKIVFEKKSRYICGQIVHYSGRVLVSASSNEPAIVALLGRKQFDQKAARILGQILAMRALESGIHSVFFDPKEYTSSQSKFHTFIEAVKENGLNLNEQTFIFKRALNDP
ncbi:39S ribosomal protein L18 [Sarcoptes scabiei]|uniref:39S ribosomal protein L18, mitochondrial n=1 Tax=Sarcoptes scabiei TaxID=52283 RepID=A0A834V8D4_SARSC|nr:39S ribosomal protein L18 [Sarcoptes scabiei]UXI16566.1 Alpha-actinin [Sarcoptes scabiei]